ncbi:MAG: hypothetical protein HOO99_14915 [Hyphomicrobiaceae bacterium]|nr:hypothetical protein [Hyphomicrobiaceae bacterium]
MTKIAPPVHRSSTRYSTAQAVGLALAIVVALGLPTSQVSAQSVIQKSQPYTQSASQGVNDDRKWAVTLFYGFASVDSDMYMAPKAWWDTKFREEAFAGGAVSYNVIRFLRDFTLEAEIGAGRRFGIGASEGWAAAYIRYDNFPWKHILRTTFAASVGVDYITKLPLSEDNADPTRARSKFLHYFSPEVTFALPDSPQHEMVFRLHHRSGVFGLFNGVRGGADAFTVGYRYRF